MAPLITSRYSPLIRRVVGLFFGLMFIYFLFINISLYYHTARLRSSGNFVLIPQQNKWQIEKTRHIGNIVVKHITFFPDKKLLPFMTLNLRILHNKTTSVWDPDNSSQILRWSKDLPKKNRDVIYLLVRKIQDAISSLTCLRNTFLKKFPYPVIIFYEESMAVKDAMKIKELLPSSVTLYLQQISLNTPYDIDETKMDWEIDPFNIGYRHMIRFQTILVHDTQIMQDVDYYLRLDGDCCVKKMDFDVFSHMREHDKSFAYVQLFGDGPLYNQNLTAQTKLYLSNNKITLDNRTSFYNSWPDDSLVVFNNFEISKMSLWLPPSPLRKYIDFIDQSGIMYYKRVGDAPIKTHALALHLPPSKLHCFHQVVFQHNNLHTHNRGLCTMQLVGSRLSARFKSNSTVSLIGEKFFLP